jgi:hypothetical protein
VLDDVAFAGQEVPGERRQHLARRLRHVEKVAASRWYRLVTSFLKKAAMVAWKSDE